MELKKRLTLKTKTLKLEANNKYSELAKIETLGNRRKIELDRLNKLVNERIQSTNEANESSKLFKKLFNQNKA